MTSKEKLCVECKHNHISETGGEDGETLTMERLSDCAVDGCGCEKGYKFE